MSSTELLLPGDYVSVHVPNAGHREGTVVGARYDQNGRHIIEVQLNGGQQYDAWYPTVTRVKRTYYTTPPSRSRWIERTVYW